MTDFNIPLDVEFYPDGEVIIFQEGNELAKFTKEQVIEGMLGNIRACDWLSLADMRELIVSLEKAIEKSSK